MQAGRAVSGISTRLAALALLAASAGAPARALINLDGTRSQIFVFGSLANSYDSNIFSDSTQRGDHITSTEVGAEWKRRRGIIAVDATAKLDYLRFSQFSSEDSWNPSFDVEFEKTAGRTTGTFSLAAERTNKADSAVNLRTTSWEFPARLYLKYPVNRRLHLTSDSGFMRRTFQDNDLLENYTDYSEGLDVLITHNSRLEYITGYRIRVSRTDSTPTAYDHSVSVGATGSLLPKVQGTVRLGFQSRDGGALQASHGQATVSASLDWKPTHKFEFTAEAGRDFTTSAVGGTVDTLSGRLDGRYSLNRRFDLSTGILGGRNRFLDQGTASRSDVYAGWSFGIIFTLNDHFTAEASVHRMTNWSTLDFSDFDRTSYSLSVSTRF